MSTPARLSKKENISFAMRWESLMYKYSPILLLLSLIILALLLFALACAIMGVSAHSFTGTEANVYYNNLEAII